MTKKTNSNLVSAILYIIVGILLIIFKGDLLNWGMTIAGAFFVISGVLDVLKKNYTSGGISLIIGIAIIVLGWLAVEIVLLVLGILVAVKGITAILEVLKGEKKEVLDFLFPVITTVAGLAIAFGKLVDWIIIVGGILLIVDGVLGLVEEFKK